MLRPLHNASLSDISTPLNISDIFAPQLNQTTQL